MLRYAARQTFIFDIADNIINDGGFDIPKSSHTRKEEL